MALIDKINNGGPKELGPSLSKEEYEYLFAIIRNTNFKGDQLETLYVLVSKLQQQYLNLKQ